MKNPLKKRSVRIRSLRIRIEKNVKANEFRFKFSDPFIPNHIKSTIAYNLLKYYDYGESEPTVSAGNNA